MKTLAAVMLAVFLGATPVPAQVTLSPVQPAPSVFGPDPVMRVTVAFRTSAATAETQPMGDAQAAETVRRTLYGMAAAECAVLAEVFKAECRLNSVAMPTVFGTVNSSGVMTATALYELKPKDFSPGR